MGAALRRLAALAAQPATATCPGLPTPVVLAVAAPPVLLTGAAPGVLALVGARVVGEVAVLVGLLLVVGPVVEVGGR